MTLLLHSQLYLWDSPFLVRFLCMWPCFNPAKEEVTFCPCGWSMLGVFLIPAFTHLGHESVWWNACVHRLDFSLYSHLKEFGGNGVKNNVNSKGKIPSTEGSDKVRSRFAASHRTASMTHYRLNCFWVSYMHAFSIFVFAPVQRNWACFTWKSALEIRSLLLLLLLLTIPVPTSMSHDSTRK